MQALCLAALDRVDEIDEWWERRNDNENARDELFSRALAASNADIVGDSWSFLVDDSIVRNDAQHALQYFFQVRPSVLHLFSSLITFIRCS